MKSLKLLAVVAVFGALFVSCEADSITEDEQLIEIQSTTGDKVDVPEDPDNDGN